MRRLIQHSIILTNKFTTHTLRVWATVGNHLVYLMFGYLKVIEHQKLANKSNKKYKIKIYQLKQISKFGKNAEITI